MRKKVAKCGIDKNESNTTTSMLVIIVTLLSKLPGIDISYRKFLMQRTFKKLIDVSSYNYFLNTKPLGKNIQHSEINFGMPKDDEYKHPMCSN